MIRWKFQEYYFEFNLAWFHHILHFVKIESPLNFDDLENLVLLSFWYVIDIIIDKNSNPRPVACVADFALSNVSHHGYYFYFLLPLPVHVGHHFPFSFQCDGVDITRKIKDLKLHCILFLNIPKYGAGTVPWGNPSSSTSGFEPQRHDDGYIEIIGFTAASLVCITQMFILLLLLLRSFWSYIGPFLSIFCISPRFITPYRPGNSDFTLFACRNVLRQLGVLA
jgi:hypothetical protein